MVHGTKIAMVRFVKGGPPAAFSCLEGNVMAARRNDPGEWMPAFFAALGRGVPIKRAATVAGVSVGTAYYYRRRNPEFAARWEATQDPGAPSARLPFAPPAPALLHAGWRVTFFEALVETSNVSVSAARAGVPLSTVYKLKRRDAAFAGRWRAALHEGYDNLEMELLGHLRDPRPRRRMDVAAALRLLVAHRETVARERALREDDDEQAVLESIDAFIEDMRQRRLANTAIVAETGAADDED
jgi:hypothetical protein